MSQDVVIHGIAGGAPFPIYTPNYHFSGIVPSVTTPITIYNLQKWVIKAFYYQPSGWAGSTGALYLFDNGTLFETLQFYGNENNAFPEYFYQSVNGGPLTATYGGPNTGGSITMQFIISAN